MQIIKKDFGLIHFHFKKLEEDDSEKWEKQVQMDSSSGEQQFVFTLKHKIDVL